MNSIVRRNAGAATAIASIAANVGRSLVALLTLPALFTFLGNDTFGFWLVALSLMGFVNFINSGVSSATVTYIARASASTDVLSSLPPIIYAAAVLAIGLGFLVAAVSIPIILLTDWHGLLKLGPSLSPDDVKPLLLVIALILATGFVVMVPRQVMLGMQQGYIAFALDFLGVLFGAVALLSAVHLKAPLWVLGLALLAPSYLITLIVGTFYLAQKGLLRFSWEVFRSAPVFPLVRDAARMSGYQAAFVVSSQSDLLLIGIFLGAPASVAYGIAHRVFSFPTMAIASVNYAQWPAIAKADAAGKHKEMYKLFWRTLISGTAAAVIAALCILLFYNRLVEMWFGTAIATDPLILVGMICWVLISTLVGTCDIMLRAQNASKFLLRCMIGMALINVSSSIVLIQLIGPAGAIFGSVVGYAVGLLLPYIYQIRTTEMRRRLDELRTC